MAGSPKRHDLSLFPLSMLNPSMLSSILWHCPAPSSRQNHNVVAHRQGGVALILDSDHQAVEALPLAVRWRGPGGDLASDAVHAEGQVLIPVGDVVGEDAVETDIPVSGAYLGHRRATANILQGETAR